MIAMRIAKKKPTTATKAVRGPSFEQRTLVLMAIVVLAFFAVAVRLFVLQILQRSVRTTSDRPYGATIASRGDIYMLDPKDTSGFFPAAINKTLYTVFADTKALIAPSKKKGASDRGLGASAIVDDTARRLAPLLQMDEQVLRTQLSATDDLFVPLRAKVDDAMAQSIKLLDIPGIGLQDETLRYYPERSVAHVVGYLGIGDDGEGLGKYGVEGYMDDVLRGSTADRKDGSDLELTIDRNIQFVACGKLRDAVNAHRADGGAVVVLDPKTGSIMAMCGYPDFDPNTYSKTENISAFNNPAIFTAYEPGSVFKPFTMAAAIDAGAISPSTTYVDEGELKIGPYTIRNSDKKAHGLQTMTDVLENSLNTGTVFAQRTIGAEAFRTYIHSFGFGERGEVEMQTESAGDVSQLDKKGDIWPATASYGQGITVTPLQLAVGYGAIANGGTLMRPHIIGGVRHSDGTRSVTTPKATRQVISKRASSLVSGMMVRVVENGHGKRAAVPGYFVAGKTGTAQIASANGKGYVANEHNGSFAGFAPVDDPAFVMVVRIDRPKDVDWAEASAAPLFGDIASFLLHYLQIPPERPLK